MEYETFCPRRLRNAISSRSLERALNVLAEVTSATIVLFDAVDDVLAGPVPGNAFIRELIATDAGKAVVLAAHKASLDSAEHDGKPSYTSPLTDVFAYSVLPLSIADRRAGAMVIADQGQDHISEDVVANIAALAGVNETKLQAAAAQLKPWSAAQTTAAQNLAQLLGDLFAELCARDSELERRVEELNAVYNIAGLMAASQDLKQVLHKVAAVVCDVMKVKACSIRLLDEATGRLAIMAVYNLSDQYLNKGPVTVDENPTDAKALQGQMIRILDVPNDPRIRYPQEARNEGLVSLLCCGMIYRGKPVGVLRVYTGESHVFTPFEESLLQAVASQVAAGIVNARLFAETLEAERVSRQLAYAGEVQRRMIPANPPCCERVEIGAVYRPTFDVGGDFYDFMVMAKSNLGVAIADVSGKGVPASLQMASLRAALRVNAHHMYHIDRILAEVNRHMCRDTTAGEFASLFYGVINAASGRFTYCNAGHNPPVLLRNGEVQYLETGGIVLGIEPEATFERGIMDLKTDDLLLLYTDGAVEALNFADEQFGTGRLTDSLRRYADHPAQRVAQNILWDIRRFRGLADRTDDLTLVVLKIH